VLVDGAINRLASASPLVTDATILASGASLGPTMDDVIKKTIFRKELFTKTVPEEKALLKAAHDGIEKGNAALLHRNGNDFRVESVRGIIPLLAGAQLLDKCREETAALVFGGALVDDTLLDIMESFKKLPLVVVNDATRVFISPEIYYRFLSRGGDIFVLNEMKLLAVTLNPTDPSGRDYNPGLFLEKMKDVLKPYPVYDLVYQEGMVQ
jgi:hypothetical protein